MGWRRVVSEGMRGAPFKCAGLIQTGSHRAVVPFRRCGVCFALPFRRFGMRSAIDPETTSTMAYNVQWQAAKLACLACIACRYMEMEMTCFGGCM